MALQSALSPPAAHHFVHSSPLIAGSFGKRFCSSVCVLNLAQKLLVPAVAVIRVGSFVRSAGVGQEGAWAAASAWFFFCASRTKPKSLSQAEVRVCAGTKIL